MTTVFLINLINESTGEHYAIVDFNHALFINL